MRNLTIVTAMAAFMLMLGMAPTANACGTCASCVASASQQQAAEQTGMACGCPMTEQSMEMHQKMNVLEMAKHAGTFNTLVLAIESAGMEKIFESDGPFTVFAPTDEAFARMSDADLNALLKDKKRLKDVLTYHVHSGLLMSKDVMKEHTLSTINGHQASIMVEPCGLMIDRATVTSTDIIASNGVIHVIDRVNMPGAETSYHGH